MEALKERVNLDERLAEAAQVGMTLAVWADLKPDATFIHDPDGRTRTFGEVNANANRIVRLLRKAGLKAGDAVALVCTNRAEFVEVLGACQRSGLRITPVNWHLTADEIAYIVQDCEAKALFADAKVAASGPAAHLCTGLVAKIAIGGDIEGFTNYDQALASLDGSDIEDPVLGNQMMYTSGTTGRPKGVYRPNPVVPVQGLYALRGYDHATSVQMCAGPAYHAAPLAFDVRGAMGAGCELVFMDKWDSENTLRTIVEKRVTHMHLVPIMFQRLLALPDEVKHRYDVSHVKYIVHGAAPCPPEVKLAMIEWFGPIVNEYYAGSEGGAGFVIDSHEWLKKPGSVGKAWSYSVIKILDDAGDEVPAGQTGLVYMQMGGSNFQYHKSEEKTRESRVGDLFTVGDIGYLDEDGYLFLCDRKSDLIISGGVNVYPAEIEGELVMHPGIADVAVFGVPDEEWGEAIKAVVQPVDGVVPSDELTADIMQFAAARLANYKLPKTVEYLDELPRDDNGKLYKRKLRDASWAGREKVI
jgi:long-chain acyl-CoA synthetase